MKRWISPAASANTSPKLIQQQQYGRRMGGYAWIFPPVE
jgi:hypothetical protein